VTNNNQQASGGAEGAKPHRVSVTAPARLHFGFLNLHGGLGRRFGSFGMAVDGFSTRLYAVPTTNADNLRVEGPDHYRQTIKRASSFANTITDGLDLERAAAITIEEAIPDHAGLGSGTQLGLAVATVLTKLHGLDLGVDEMARLLGRGARSGIGIGVFEQGGVILDGGVAGDGSDDGADNGENGPPSPATSRLAFPDEWRLMLILDLKSKGLHGGKESAAFDVLPPYQPEQAADLCRMIIMQALPALAEKNISGFGRAVTALQEAVGDHFAAAQGGRYSSPRVGEVLSWLAGQGVEGYGQSSWGPTGFAFFEGEAEATRMIEAAGQKWKDDGGLQFMVCGGRNQGHLIKIL
jgi:beta-RFAP synthase